MSTKLFKHNQIKALKIAGIILLFAGVLGASVLLYAGHLALQPLPALPAVTEDPFKLDPQVEAYGSELGIPKHELIAAKAHLGDAVASCKKAGTQGCYNGKIVVSPNASDVKKTLAHEYMHYVWEHKVDQATKDQVNALTTAFYSKYEYNVKPRFSFYDKYADTDVPNERQAIFCTEISDSRLPAGFLDYCKTYLPNRMALPSYF